MVLNKPHGLLTQSPPGIDSLELRVKQFIKHRESKTGKIYLVPVHRLDRPVSGAIMFAKNVRAAKRLSAQFKNRTISKTYVAMVEGIIESETDRWIDFMRKVPGEARSEIVGKQEEGSKDAILNFRVVARSNSNSLVEIELETGRTHQIRLQFSSHGHPIVGDQQYGSQLEFGEQTVDLRKRQIGLHARCLGFEHPMDHDQVEVTAPYPENWLNSEFADALKSNA